MTTPSTTPDAPGLQQFTVVVRVFDPGAPDADPVTYRLPVDSPDAEHAIAAAMSNAVSFTPIFAGESGLLPVAFQAVDVLPRDDRAE